MNAKKVIIVTSVILLVLVFLGGLGTFFLDRYKNQLNNELAQKRVDSQNIDTLKIGYLGGSTGIYPEIQPEFNTFVYNSHFYEPLTKFDENLKIQPQLALSWENPKPDTWRFRLRKNVKFQDGSTLDSEDVKKSLDLVLAGGNAAIILPTTKEVKIVDDQTVDIITKTPDPTLAKSLVNAFILPKSLIESKDFKNPIGTGPYKLTKVEDGKYFLVRNEEYYGEKPKAKNVILIPFIDEKDIVTNFKNGEIDISEAPNDPTVQKELNNTLTPDGKSLVTLTKDSTDIRFLVLDTKRDKSPYITGAKTNPFKNLKVRQAVQIAIDVNKIIEDENMKGFTAINQLATKNIFGYSNEIKTPKHDISEAKTLMEEAGYKNGFGVTLDISSIITSFGEGIKTSLAQIGIRVKVNPIAATETYMGKIFSGDSSMYSLGWGITTGDALEAYENILGAQTPLAPLYTSNPQVVALITKLKETFDQKQRMDYFDELAQLADAEKDIIPIFSKDSMVIVRNGIHFTPRTDSMILATGAIGVIPDKYKTSYDLWTATKHLLGLYKVD